MISWCLTLGKWLIIFNSYKNFLYFRIFFNPKIFFIRHNKKRKLLKYPTKNLIFFFNCPKIKRILLSGLIVVYYVLHNYFFSTQLDFCSSERFLLRSQWYWSTFAPFSTSYSFNIFFGSYFVFRFFSSERF